MSCFKLAFDDFLDFLFNDNGTKVTKKNLKCVNCDKTCGYNCTCRCHIRSCKKCDIDNCNYTKCKCDCHQVNNKTKSCMISISNDYSSPLSKNTQRV